MLYLYPEYQGQVGFVSTMLVGMAIGIFIMSWNITTFILNSLQIEFLATTTKPFLKYCFNNALLPLAFLIFYLFKAISFDLYQELLDMREILWLISGFLFGLILTLVLAFSWFFGADHTIYKYTSPGAKELIFKMKNRVGHYRMPHKPGRMRVDWYLTPAFRFRHPRDTRHYSKDFINNIFKQHHISAMLAITIAFVFLIISGYFIDHKIFQIPAAASITMIYAILIAVAGAFTYFLKQWTVPAVLIIFLGLNWLYQKDILDPRNKAYGLNYDKSLPTVDYSREYLLSNCRADSVKADSIALIQRLENWKARQNSGKPVLILTCLSGGGVRSATFTVQVMNQLDNLTRDAFTGHNFLMSGASGGIMGAAWYRELKYREQNNLLLSDSMYNNLGSISTDLLNPVFSSFAVRDILAPPRRFTYGGFTYIKDRGYAFEEQLNTNTHGWLNRPVSDYKIKEDSAVLPMMILNSVITKDGRNLMVGTQPLRFLMQPKLDSTMGPLTDVDAVCFQTLFKNRDAQNLRFLTAIRMSATFPYVLPSVWLPTRPVIDVMDAGFRDNTGMETALKMMSVFKNWIEENCSKVVLVEIRDKQQGGWNQTEASKNILDLITRPALLTQSNLFRFQEYQQYRELDRMKASMGNRFERVVFEYRPSDQAHPASLSFHITQKEKKDIITSLNHPVNESSFNRMLNILSQKD